MLTLTAKAKPLQGKVSPMNAEIVNIGQVKELFYSLEGNRGDFSSGYGETLAENARFGLSWWADSDGDGFSDLEEMLHESDPDDPTGLPSLRLEVISGNGQQVKINNVTASPITFAVKRGFSTSADGQVTLHGSIGEVSTSSGVQWKPNLTVDSANGLAAFWWQAPSASPSFGPVTLSASVDGGSGTQAYVNLIQNDNDNPAILTLSSPLPLILGAGGTASREVVATLSQQGDALLAGRQIIAQANGGAGSITPSSMMTDAQGQAVFQWRAASVIGSGTLHFSAPGLPAAQPEEIETQTIAPPILERVSLNALQGVVSSPAVVPVTLRVRQQGTALAGAKVRLSVSGFGGSLAAGISCKAK